MNSDTSVLYEGKLNIRGILKIWSERYVVLEANKRILYYKSLEQCKENKLAGTIQIDDAFVLNADKETKKQYSFKLVHQSADKETRYFQATSEAERKAWMTAISTAVFGADVENQPDTSESKKRWLSITGNFKGKDTLLDDWTIIEDPKKKGKQEVNPPQNLEQEKLEKEKKERGQKLNKLPSTVYSRERLEFFYEQYEGFDFISTEVIELEPEDQCIGPAGVEKLCKDLQVDPEDISMLIFAWKIGAQKMGFFEKGEFLNGLEKWRVDTLEKLKQKLIELRSDIKDETKFKEIYKWAFMFSKEPTQRALDAELAAALLKVLTKSRVDFPHAEDFIEYLTIVCEHSKYKAVNMDAWQSFYHFNKTVLPNLSNYNEDDAWPSMFDDFVEWKRKKL